MKGRLGMGPPGGSASQTLYPCLPSSGVQTLGKLLTTGSFGCLIRQVTCLTLCGVQTLSRALNHFLPMFRGAAIDLSAVTLGSNPG